MRTIDADELKDLYEDLDDDLRLSIRVAKANIDDMPTVDAEPIVRCKDCKYYKQLDGVCPYLGEDGYYKELPGEDDFCSRGERRE